MNDYFVERQKAQYRQQKVHSKEKSKYALKSIYSSAMIRKTIVGIVECIKWKKNTNYEKDTSKKQHPFDCFQSFRSFGFNCVFHCFSRYFIE